MSTLNTPIAVGQVWLYQRLKPKKNPPVVHVITVVDGDHVESTSVFTQDGKSHERVPLSRPEGAGSGLKHILQGFDDVGTWTLLYPKSEKIS